MNYSIITMILCLSISTFAGVPQISFNDPTNGGWVPPLHADAKFKIYGKVSEVTPSMTLTQKIDSVVYPVKMKTDGTFEAPVEIDAVKPISKFQSEFILSQNGKIIKSFGHQFYCCAFLNEGIYMELSAGKKAIFDFKKGQSLLYGVTFTIPAESIKEDQRATLGLEGNMTIPFEKYIALSPALSLRSSGWISTKGITISIPLDYDTPRMETGDAVDSDLFLVKNNEDWKTLDKTDVLILAEVAGEFVELRPGKVSKKFIEVKINDEKQYEKFIAVAKRKTK